MFKIGDFSRLTRVSVKGLRHYDRLGLLRPARTDPITGYRYYSGEQLPRLNAILALKELGFSLDEILKVLDEDLSSAQIVALLRSKRDEVRRSLEAERERLSRIEARLRSIEKEDEMPGRYEVVLKSVEALRVASVREVLPSYGAVGGLFDELRDYARRHGVGARAWIAVWYDEEFREEDVDGEAAFATDDPLPEDERVRPGELPAVQSMACTVHHGPFDTIDGAYAALLGWIGENGYRVAGPNRELYLRAGNERDNPDYVTEIQFPVEKVRS